MGLAEFDGQTGQWVSFQTLDRQRPTLIATTPKSNVMGRPHVIYTFVVSAPVSSRLTIHNGRTLLFSLSRIFSPLILSYCGGRNSQSSESSRPAAESADADPAPTIRQHFHRRNVYSQTTRAWVRFGRYGILAGTPSLRSSR